MNKDEVVTLLAACTPLAMKLLNQGIDAPLDRADREALAGFNRVRLAGWLEDNDYLHRLAGLLRSHVGLLTAIAIREADLFQPGLGSSL